MYFDRKTRTSFIFDISQGLQDHFLDTLILVKVINTSEC